MKVYKITAIICVVIMFAIGFGTLISHNKTPELSVQENRMLSGMPKFNFENIISGDFASDFEKYMIDRIPLRNSIINIQSIITQSMSIVTLNDAMNIVDTSITQQMENLDETVPQIPIPHTSTPVPTAQIRTDNVNTENIQEFTPAPMSTPDPNKFTDTEFRYIGFKESDDDIMTALVRFNTSDIIDYSNTLNQLASLLPTDGNLVYIMSLESRKVRPVLFAISENKDIHMVDETVEIIEYYTNDNTYIISAPLLFEEPLKNNENMYFFTDPHWSVEGTYRAYTEAMDKIALQPVMWEDYDISYEYPFRGAYYKKAKTAYYIENPDTLSILSFPQASTFIQYLGNENMEQLPIIQHEAVADDRYRVYFDGPQSVGPLGIIDTTSNTKRNALIILDSYGLSFSTMLIPHYDTICMMDLRYMYKSMENYYISDIIDKYEVDDLFIVVGDLNAYGTFYQTLLNQYMYGN